ncbi:MAG: NAD-dependent epimerase/dehydratase family protein [Candidatus Bathyarchaeia archaeon]|jgi:UDP-glucose 4-epimerase
MHIAVTGGAGYIGSTLIKNLITEGHSVASLDNQAKGDYSYLRRLNAKNLTLIEGDIRNIEDLDDLFSGADAVVHMAALSDLDVCNDNPEEAVSVNVYGTHRVLGAAEKTGVRRIVFCSSAAIYGIPSSLPVTERHAQRPLNLYGVTKLAGEKLVEAHHQNSGAETINLRFGNVYGVGLYTSWTGVIPKFVALGLEDRPLTVYGDGKSTRDFVHVEDVCRAIALSVTTEGILNEAFNIGCETTTVNMIASLVAEEIEKATEKRPEIKHLPSRVGETKEFSYDTSKIEKTLGFRPKWRLREGVRQLTEYRLWNQKP